MKFSFWGGVAVAAAAAAVACGGGGSRTVPTTPGSATLSAPTAQSPVNNAQLDTLRPTLVIANSTASETGAKTYEFQISAASDFFDLIVSQSGVAEGSGGTTSFTPSSDLQASAQLYWRARAQQGSVFSAWSTAAQFRTKAGGFNTAGALFDPLNNGQTIGERSGSTTFMGDRGLRVDNANSWVKYQLAQTLTSGEISVEVSGLFPNHPGEKSRIFSMADGTPRLFDSPYLFNVQYRGLNGNPPNAISFKLLHGGESFKYEPDFTARADGIRLLNPDTVYLWTATWGSSFRLTVREGGAGGAVIYDRTMGTPGTYNPVPHTVYLGATDANIESGSWPGAIYRNLWVGSGPRPATIK